MSTTRRRIEKLEEAYTPPPSSRPIQRFLTRRKPGIDPVEDLRARGHDVRDGDIVRIIVDPPKRDEDDNIIPFPGEDR